MITLCIASFAHATQSISLLHVSFDTTRELFKEINQEFIANQKALKIRQSHGGSGKQTLAIMHGLPADIVSLALPYHMDLLAEKHIVNKNWRQLFPNEASPLSTNIIFLVRKHNPKQISDWSDLIRPDVKIITANPKTSGGALWNYIAAWIYATKNFPADPQTYMRKLYHNASLLDSSARNAAVTFVTRGLGDVLITWKNEAKYIIAKLNSDYEIIEPSLTVKINIPVAYTINRKHQELSKNYIDFLFSTKGQTIISKYYYQSIDATSQNMVNADDYIDWSNFKKIHFGENGLFDQIYN